MPTSSLNPTPLEVSAPAESAAVPKSLRVLIVEDYEPDALLLRRYLARAGYQVDARSIETADQLRDALADPAPWDLVLADYTLPSFGARDALRLIQQSGVDLPFIIVSGTIDEVSAVEAMRAGAHDYVLKGHLERLIPAIERELAEAQRRRERVHTEAELRLAQQRFSATFNQAAVGMAHATTDGRFLLVNRRLSERLGVPIADLLHHRLWDFLLPSERELDIALYRDLIEGRCDGYRVERQMVRSDGTTFPAQFTASLLRPPTDHGGHDPAASTDPITVLWVVEDISARKAAERETGELMQRLINSERLAAAGRMANTLAHEINNPLEALTNIFYILQTHELEPQSQELMAIAARELERVGNITRSTLSFYRKVPGRTLDLYSLLTEVVQLFQTRANQHSVSLVVRLDESTRSARYDPQLRQVFANLVGNALESMEASGGTITLRARLVCGKASVIVSDTGTGIEQANLHSIFEPFFTTKGERGTGLGLWVTRGIVEEQGGRLQLRTSTLPSNHGTCIRITLPAKSEGVVSKE